MAATTSKPSPARLAANRANAKKSTGPRTEAGKARSRANAVKHGLTGAGIALPVEDAARIEAEFLQAQEEFAPTTLAGMRLVHDVATIWARQDRARRWEALTLDRQARRAGADFDRARAERADWFADHIEADPRAHRRALLAMPEGVDRLVAGLEMLLGEMAGPAPVWTMAHHKRLDALFGFKAGDLPVNRPTRFSRGFLGDLGGIGVEEVADVPPDELKGWLIARLVEAIGAEIESLAGHRAAIDAAAIAAERAEAVALGGLDPGRDGALAQRYLAAAGRDLARTLRDLHLVESRYGTDAEVEADPVADAAPEPDPAPENNPDPVAESQVTERLASFGGAAPIVSFAVSSVVTPAPNDVHPPILAVESVALSLSSLR